MMKILFVCTGNSCRSPMAELYFNARAAELGIPVTAESAGIYAGDGAHASFPAAAVMAELGIDASPFRSRAFTPERGKACDLIVGMTRSHAALLRAAAPGLRERICTLVPGADVPDPFGGSVEHYRQVFGFMRGHLDRLLSQLNNQLKEKRDIMSIKEITGRPLTIGVGTDHSGFSAKAKLVALLESLGHKVVDFGPAAADPADDYPDFSAPAARALSCGVIDAMVLICRTGFGMAMVANRFHGVRAVVAGTPELAKKGREHNAANCLVLPGDACDEDRIGCILKAFLSTPFSGAERHARRLGKLERATYDDIAALRATDPEIAAAIDRESARQNDGIELIASENFASCAVRAAQGSVLTNKYAEGYSGKRYYNGCEFIDQVETLAVERAKALFGAEAANVQPHSGSGANQAVYTALCQPGDTVLAMSLDHGGHLTHGHPLNFSGKLYKIVPYGVSRETEMIDYDEVERLAVENKPRMILAGASAYPRILDFPRLRAIADKVGALLFVDMAHIAGLVAAGVHPSPVPYCDVVTTTTHKTLRGPRGGLILCKEQYLKAINSAVFPGLQGGPLEHVIAAKAVCFLEALKPEFKAYQQQVKLNAAKLASELAARGFRIVSGGTDNHLMLIDLRPKQATGKAVANALDLARITVNKNMIPFDPEKPFVTSGIRIGTPAVTTRGLKEAEMVKVAEFIDRGVALREDEAALRALGEEVKAFMADFPMPQFK